VFREYFDNFFYHQIHNRYLVGITLSHDVYNNAFVFEYKVESTNGRDGTSEEHLRKTILILSCSK